MQSDSSLPTPLQQHVREFETECAGWDPKSGIKRPSADERYRRAAESLKSASPADRSAFMTRIVYTDIHLRRRVAEEPQLEDYPHDFADQADAVRAAFDEVRAEFLTTDEYRTPAPNPWPELMNADAAVPRPESPQFVEGPGTVIGPYKLLEQIGEGGFGVVFMAEQLLPVRRKVALKLIKPGMDTRQVIARFEAERQALALMDHPNIAKVLDGGATALARPFFVMELVKGVPITDYSDQNQLAPRERLELFLQVCQAVQHAHQKGIVHRDLKPSNVLVSMHDATPVVKVIDFGVAKALGQVLTDKTLFTRFAEMVGTRLYMSPEQAGQSSLDIDTRSDIYSLGVLLYELLTGTTPFDKERFEQAANDEIRRIIREEDPPKPSTRLSTTADLPSIAAKRKLEPKKLTKLVEGDLDWIVMKALEKDRRRRYETANAFAMDVQNYLADRPVLACPPSVMYRLRKFARRHKTPVLAASVIFFLLVGGFVGTSWGLVRAETARKAEAEQRAEVERQKQLVEGQRDRAVTAERQAKAGEQNAEQSADEARAVLEFFLEKVLAAARPEELEGGLGYDVTIRAAVDAAAPEIGPAFQDQPLVEAAIRHTLGETYYCLGEADLAISHHERSRQLLLDKLGSDHPDTLASSGSLGLAYWAADRLDQAVPLLEETLQKRNLNLGIDHPKTLTSKNNLALTYQAAGQLDLALQLFQETLEKRKEKLGPDHPDTLTSMNNLANAHQAAGQPDMALALLKETWEKRKATLGREHPSTLLSMTNLGSAYRQAGYFDQALMILTESSETAKAKLGTDHPITLTSINNLASAYQAAGQLNQALPLLQETLVKRKRKLGSDHVDTLSSMNNLVSAYLVGGQLNEALSLCKETMAKATAKHGPDHPITLASMNFLARAYQALGKLELALPLHEETLERRKAKLGPDHPDTLQSMNNLAAAYQAAGKLDRALQLYEETLEKAKPKLGHDHPDTLNIMNNLAVAYHAAGRLNRALPLFKATLEKRKAKLGPNHPSTLNSMIYLASAYYTAGQNDQALVLFEESLEKLKKEVGIDHPQTLTAMNNLALAYRADGRTDQAVLLLEETLERQKANLGPDHPDTLRSMNNLALVHKSAGRINKAVPLYEETVAKQKQRLGPKHPETLNTMNNLAAAYQDARELARALTLYEETLEKQKENVGSDHPDTLSTMNNLATAYIEAGLPDKAEPLFTEVVTGLRPKLGFAHPHTQTTLRSLADCYAKLGQPQKAEPLWRELAAFWRVKAPDSPQYAAQLAGLGLNLLEQQKPADAERTLRECLLIREKTEADAWTTFNTKSMLGGSLLGQKNYADAEPLLLAGHEGMKKREAKIPAQGKPRLTEALERLVQLYDAWSKPDEAAAWRTRLEEMKAKQSEATNSPKD